MTNATWIPIALGLALGALYGVASYVSLRRAQRKEGSEFVKAALGGIAIRLFAAVVVLVSVLLFSSIDPVPFVVAFMGLYVIALAVEAYLLHTGVPGGQHT